MTILYDREQPVAGPSNRPYNAQFTDVKRKPNYEGVKKRKVRPPVRRQDVASTSQDSTASSPTGSSSAPLFLDPTSTSNTASSGTSTTSQNPTGTQSSISQSASSTSLLTSTHAPTTSSTSSFSQPWKPSTKSTVSHAPQETPYVPGVIFPLVLGGDADDEAVYSVEMSFGHITDSSNRKRRPSGYDWNGGDPQTVNLQIDLGSSDMWVASVDCTTSDCQSAPALFNPSESLDASTDLSFDYQSGEVSGDVYWEQVALGDFSIGYQAFLAADQVSSEDLSGGNFTGVLGLALPANSVILSKIAGSTSGNPDGATFLDNLFGGGTSAPTQRLFSLSLERREDTRTTSTFGIGTVSSSACPSPCTPKYIPIVAQSNLGAVGYLHWRVPLDGITATTWSDQEGGSGASTQNITLGASVVDPSKRTPLAVLDSGGVAILVGYKTYADAIYAPYGISASADGLYRMPCTTQLSLSFIMGGQTYPVHPLDLSWPDPTDPSQTTCIGAVQYSSTLGTTGDFILGSAFLKNVYSIFQYPDNNGSTTKVWQPTVGMVPLTNASVAVEDFYAVRVEHQSLSSVSQSHDSGVGTGSSTTGGGSQASSDQLAKAGHVLSSAGIAGISVVAFFIFAAAAFCAWWFWLRRRFGKNGKVIYSDVPLRRRSTGHKSDTSTSSLRNKKHDAAQRQKSMVEGYSDYEDSWQSTTENDDSIRLGYLPEVVEEEEGKTRGVQRTSRGSSLREESAGTTGDPGELIDVTDPAGGETGIETAPSKDAAAREKSPSAADTLSAVQQDGDLGQSRYPLPYAYPGAPPAAPRGASLSMSGPFPSPAPGRQSIVRPDASPMYDIRSSDYFDMAPAIRGREGRRASGASMRDGSGARGQGASPRRPSQGVMDRPLVETPLMEEPEARE